MKAEVLDIDRRGFYEYLRVSKMKERVRTFAIVFKQDIRVLTFHILNLFKNANVKTGDGIVYNQVS